jgi:methylated-DNA-protein-cysteine methyltransferase related protein
MSLRDKALKMVGRIPRGKVSTYGQIAKMAGVESARPVGNWLHTHKQPITIVPCHRVVNAQGGLAKNFGAKGKINTQAKRLRIEGVKVKNNKVDLDKYLWIK